MSLEISDNKNFSLTPETNEQPAGIYVHIPFCRTKCPYCSFISYPGSDSAHQASYLKALSKQVLEMAAHPWAGKRTFHSLFIGGGTPSSVDPVKLTNCIAFCLNNFNYSENGTRKAEVTVEVNPNTVTPDLLEKLRAAGVNRLSIGTQSFSETMLNNIGRTHTVKDNFRAFERARAAGFANINLDLMYGLPGQDETIWKDTLQQALALAPEHFSIYELTIEPGTPFAERPGNGKLELPSEKTGLAMFGQARELLSINGYRHYEISNYGRPGFACRHNVNYWENGNYIGLGAGAVSCFSGVRVRNEERTDRFIEQLNNKQPPYSEAEFLPLEARFRETVIMGLRLIEGVSVTRLQQRFGLTPQKYYGDLLDNLMNQGLIEEAGNRLRLTRRGLVLANRVME
jgi:putative oxygen-independent coproporphyrinogen III oxidase